MDCAELWKTTRTFVLKTERWDLDSSFYNLMFTRLSGSDPQDPSQQVRWQKDEEAGSFGAKSEHVIFSFSPDLYSFLISLHWAWTFSERIFVETSLLKDSSIIQAWKMSARDMLSRSSVGRRVIRPAPGTATNGWHYLGLFCLSFRYVSQIGPFFSFLAGKISDDSCYVGVGFCIVSGRFFTHLQSKSPVTGFLALQQLAG